MFEVVFHALKIAVGLGFVIFVHELGHFLVAKWSGVRVERFSLGFGPVVARMRRGETEYVLSALPLGGYVHMLGESPEESESPDPRAFSSQTVGKRMGIISAGVVMNLMFGFLLFIGAFSIGVPFTVARVDAVVPGAPAWQAGIEAGDRIVRINRVSDPDFEDLLMEVRLTNPDDELVELDIDRGNQHMTFRLQPVMPADRPIIGIVPPRELEIPELATGDPMVEEGFPGYGVLKSGDRIVAVGDTPVETLPELEKQLYKHRHNQFALTVERDGQRRTLVLKPQGEYSLGLRMKIGRIQAVQDASPALDKVKPDDIIVAVDEHADFDPERLCNYAADRALAGKTIKLLIRREQPDQQEAKELTVELTPRPASIWGRTYRLMGRVSAPPPYDVPALGLAYAITTTVAAVKPGSPADKAGIKPGQRVLAVREHTPAAGKGSSRSSATSPDRWVALTQWQLFAQLVRGLGPCAWELQVGTHTDSSDVVVTPVPDPSNPSLNLGIAAFGGATRIRRAANLLHACRIGWSKSLSTVKWVYLTFRGMLVGTVSPRDLGGPIRIGETAYVVSRHVGFSSLVFFLGLLSINLAVINFLPIPVLDGGHMLFLIVEKLRGKPASPRALAVANSVGFLFIITLFLFLTFNDISKIVMRP